MAIDLTGGLAIEKEYVFAEKPDNPEMRDSVSFWVSDDRGQVGLSRIGIEAVSANWQSHGIQVNVAFPDGKVYRLRQDAESLSPLGRDGQPTILGAGPLKFECVEPFTTWRMTFDGEGTETSTFDLIEGRTDGPMVPLRFEVEATLAVPPWIQGALNPDAADKLSDADSIEGDLMGGPRYEQLFRSTGAVHVGGEDYAFTGTGLRIKRQGVRRLAGFWGHCWQSALFPSGRAFGYIAYPPRDDGQPTYNEGYIFSGDGDLIPALVVEAPWLTKLQALGQDVSVVLKTSEETMRIEGETVVSTYDIHHADKTFSSEAMLAEAPAFPALQQAGVRYRWDGEETYGMMERSSPLDKIER